MAPTDGDSMRPTKRVRRLEQSQDGETSGGRGGTPSRSLSAVTSRVKGFSVTNTFASSARPEKTSDKPLRSLKPLPPPIVKSRGRDKVLKKATPLPAPPDLATSKKRDPTDAGAIAGPSRATAPPAERKLLPLNSFAPPPASPSKSKPLHHLPAFVAPTTKSTTTFKRPLKTPPRPPALGRATSPAKPLSETPATKRGEAWLLNVVAAEEVKEDVTGGKKLLDSIPQAPTKAFEWEGETAEGPESWSPRKRNKGYLLTGLASRLSSQLSKSRTEHTLWLHTLSRTLSSQSSRLPLPLPLLAKLLQPSLRLRILEVLSLRSERLGPTTRHWEESKIVLARCRILLPFEDDEDESSEEEREEEDPTPDLEGLVQFSLHSHPTASSSTSLPHRKRPPPFTNTELTTATIFVPTTPHDLRLLVEKQEVWVWDPWKEVSLPSEIGNAQGGEEEERVEGEVVWEPRTEEERNKEREAKEKEEKARQRVYKALVCSRFGLVV